jgi:hypothetical protein
MTTKTKKQLWLAAGLLLVVVPLGFYLHDKPVVTNFVNYLKDVPSESWTQLWVAVGSSTAVAVVLQTIKHWLSIENRKKLIMGLLSLLSFVASIADWLIQHIAANPLLLGKNTAAVLGTAVLVHRFFVSPIYNRGILAFKELLADAQAERDRRNAALSLQPAAASAVPATAKEFTL